MATNSAIEWTHHTFNPWSGCTKVSEGCKFCYAETNYSVKMRGVKWGPHGNRVVKAESGWKEPLKWDRAAKAAGERHRVFCASLADVFEHWLGVMVDASDAALHVCAECGAWKTMERMCHGPNAHSTLSIEDVRQRLFSLIDTTPNLDWLLLTKRPENIEKMWPPIDAASASIETLLTNHMRAVDSRIKAGGIYNDPAAEHVAYVLERGRVAERPNIWLGTSLENQKTKERIDVLREIPATIRFLSLEPLLEDVGELDLRGIHWVIIGGESGPGARPCNIAWIRSIVEQCKAAGVACFVKQLGAEPYEAPEGITPNTSGPDAAKCRLYELDMDRKGGNPVEWPHDLRVREFPVERPLNLEDAT